MQTNKSVFYPIIGAARPTGGVEIGVASDWLKGLVFVVSLADLQNNKVVFCKFKLITEDVQGKNCPPWLPRYGPDPAVWSPCRCEDHWRLPSAFLLRGFYKEVRQPDQKDLLSPAPAGPPNPQEDDGGSWPARFRPMTRRKLSTRHKIHQSVCVCALQEVYALTRRQNILSHPAFTSVLTLQHRRLLKSKLTRDTRQVTGIVPSNQIFT